MRTDDLEGIAVNVSGNYYRDGAKHKVIYVESVEGEEAVIVNTMIIEDNRFEIIKEGLTNSRMTFVSNGKRYKALYQTPFGDLDMETQTRLLLVDMNEDQINVNLDYALYLDGVHISDANMYLHIAGAA